MRKLVFLMLAVLIACAPVDPTAPTDKITGGIVYDVTPIELPSEESTPEPTTKFTVEGVEGELLSLHPEAIDPDNDKVSFSFTEPFSDDGEWQTRVGDEGTYFVAVTARDSKGARTTETIRVLVHRANRAPVINCEKVVVYEGDKIDLHDSCDVSDEDDNEVIVTYGGWMTSWRYTTTYNDAGEYIVEITASDRRQNENLHTVKENVQITVVNVNRPPVFSDEFPVKIYATEKDVITLPKDLVTDPDGDKVTVTFSDPFNPSGVWRTKLGDGGSYSIDVVASDGETTAKRTVLVEVGLLNTAPSLDRIPAIVVDEGQKVVLTISATDREGDDLRVHISGWMDSEEYQTTYNDAGKYTVRVAVTDGALTTDQIVDITVQDVNRPPVFVSPA